MSVGSLAQGDRRPARREPGALWRRALADRDALAVSGLTVLISIRSPREDLCWWGAACNLIPSRLQRSYPLPGFREVSLRRVRQFTILQMDAARPVLVKPPAVMAVLRTTELRHDELLIQRP